VRVVSRKFEGFTLVPVTGYWKGQEERALAIEIDTDRTADAYEVAREIKEMNGQEAILLQRFSPDSRLL
jgi:hypothetical protein